MTFKVENELLSNTLDTFLNDFGVVLNLDLHIERTWAALNYKNLILTNEANALDDMYKQYTIAFKNNNRCELDFFKFINSTILNCSSINKSAKLNFSYSDLRNLYLMTIEKTKSNRQIVSFSINEIDLQKTEVKTRDFEKQLKLKIKISQAVRRPSGYGIQNFKWHDRSEWNQILNTLENINFDDLAFINDQDYFTEFSKYNIFFADHKSKHIFTPSLETGCVAGIFRQACLNKGFVNIENQDNWPLVIKDIKLSEWNSEDYQIFAGNSVRGLIPCIFI